MYANDNGGRYPAGFEGLLLTQDITSEVFVCPSSNDERATGDTPADVAKNLSTPGHLSYVYVGAGLSLTSPANAVVAYENPKAHEGDGMNVLYNDGHVEFQNKKTAAAHLVAEIAAGRNPPRALVAR